MNHRARVRARAIASPATSHRWLALAAAAGVIAVMASAAHGQSGRTASDAVPPATSQAAPAEITPGHPAPAAAGSTWSSGPQAATTAPLPPSARADTPGGSSRDGVIKPPAVTGDQDINRGAPRAGALGTPVIPPPGTAGGDPKVVPK